METTDKEKTKNKNLKRGGKKNFKKVSPGDREDRFGGGGRERTKSTFRVKEDIEEKTAEEGQRS